MIRLNLEIADPTRSDGPKLLALAALFTQLAQGNSADQVREMLDKAVAPGTGARVVGASPNMSAPYAGQGVGAASQAATTGALDPADNPAAGIPSPAEAFGVGNDAAGSASASSQSNALTSAASDAVALPDPAAVFAGNGPGASLGTPSGTPPAPNSGAQTAGANTPASGAGTVDLDNEGLPWDASIHASTKAKLQNGNWKLKRGVGETYVNERKAVLRAALNAGNGAPAGVPATPPANAAVPSPAGAGAPVPPPPPSNPGNVPAAAGTPTPQALAQTTPAAAGSSVTMAQLLPRVTAAMGAGLLTPDSVAGLAKEISGGSIDNVAMFAVRPDLIPALWARLDVLGIPA